MQSLICKGSGSGEPRPDLNMQRGRVDQAYYGVGAVHITSKISRTLGDLEL